MNRKAALKIIGDTKFSPPHYARKGPVLFFGGPFSNFADSPFRAKPMYDLDVPYLVYPTVEHWFQAHKTYDPDVFINIAQANGPSDAKMRGQSREWKLRENWDDGISYDVMLVGCMHKFADDPFRTILVETDDHYIAEDSPYDYIWGIRDSNYGWTGKNLLGEALMEVRALLKEEGY